MNLFSVQLPILIATLIVNLILAFSVYKNNPKSATNIIFSLLGVVTSTWLVVNFIALHPDFLNNSLFLSRLSIFLAVPQILLFFLLAHTLPSEKLSLDRRILIGVLILSGFIMTINISPFAFTKVEIKSGAANPIAGPGIAPFALYAILLSVTSVIILTRRLIKSKGLTKEQLRFMLYGILGMLGLLSLTVLGPVALLKKTTFIPLSPLYTLVFLGMTTYAIIKHRMLDIRLVVARTVSFALLTGLLGLLYALPFVAISNLVLNTTLSLKVVSVFTLLTIIMAFSFQTIRLAIEKITDKIFYRDKYDSNKLLYNLALVMASTLHLEDLTHQFLKRLLQEMRISRGAFILTHKSGIYQVAHEGFNQAPYLDEQKINLLQRDNQISIFEELPEGEIKNIMRDLNLFMVFPFYTGGEDKGLLVLGEKLSGDIYTSEDIKVLEILVPEAAVAIQNAKSYEEVKRFNITLAEEVRKATADLQQANTKLQELDKLKNDFVSVASHELRTPMTAIRSYAWMALHRSDVPLSAKLEKYIVRVLISTERLINLVNDMLNISRIESGKIEINPEPVDLLKLVKDIVDEVYYSKSQEKNLHFYILEKPIPKVLADPEKLREVLLNLVGNSLKFTPNEGKITFGFFSDGLNVEVYIKDTGIGISKDDIGRLFQKFGRLDSSYIATSSSGGTGLGLFISKNLIKLMQGKIWASSEGLDKGTTVTISLPAATKERVEHISQFVVKAQGEAKHLEPVAI